MNDREILETKRSTRVDHQYLVGVVAADDDVLCSAINRDRVLDSWERTADQGDRAGDAESDVVVADADLAVAAGRIDADAICVVDRLAQSAEPVSGGGVIAGRIDYQNRRQQYRCCAISCGVDNGGIGDGGEGVGRGVVEFS